jgi:hypothetical protein
MPEKEHDLYRGAVRFAVVPSVLAAMIGAMALLEYSGGNPRPVQTSDNPTSRQ